MIWSDFPSHPHHKVPVSQNILTQLKMVQVLGRLNGGVLLFAFFFYDAVFLVLCLTDLQTAGDSSFHSPSKSKGGEGERAREHTGASGSGRIFLSFLFPLLCFLSFAMYSYCGLGFFTQAS